MLHVRSNLGTIFETCVVFLSILKVLYARQGRETATQDFDKPDTAAGGRQVGVGATARPGTRKEKPREVMSAQ